MNSEWINCEIADLGNVVGGATPSTKKIEYYNGEIPWITPKDLSDHKSRFINRGERNITLEGLRSCSTQILPKNTVLFSSRAPIGYVAIAANDLCTNQGFKSVIPNDKTDFMFLFYLLKYNKDAIENMASGTTFKEVSGATMRKIVVRVPDLETQKRIAKVLSALDDKIELNNQINKNLEEQIKSIFESWFVTFNHFGGSKPSEMQHVPLEQLCEVVTKGTTPTTMGKAFVSHGVNFIKAETITDSHTIDFERLAHIDNETDSMLKRSRIKKGDILFTIAGTLGRFALVDSDVLPANTNQAVAIIRPNQNKVSSEYLYSFLIANWHNDYYSKRIQQAVQANLSLTTIKSLPIAILSRELAQQYDKLIRKLISLIKANEQENRKLFQFRDTLLPKLMSGEIDVDNVAI